jgi:hypothetical protein
MWRMSMYRVKKRTLQTDGKIGLVKVKSLSLVSAKKCRTLPGPRSCVKCGERERERRGTLESGICIKHHAQFMQSELFPVFT